MNYAIIDIETTGGNALSDKITEIAIYIHDGKKVIDEYATLINPQRSIPPFITSLTGISNEMVANAPQFFEVAKKIVEITENSIFVAHNVNFDYRFVCQEFKLLGYNYHRKTLDSVRLSRKLLPGHASYSLGKICDDLGIGINGRHRAAGDALATVELFELLLEKGHVFQEVAFPEQFKLLKGIDTQAHRDLLNKLREQIGVYYFYDNDKRLIYIGKSINVKKRVAQHLRSNGSAKALEIRARIADISFEQTGSELIALLLESDEIKKHQPIYNRAQRRSIFPYALYSKYDFDGYINFYIEKTNKKFGEPVGTFLNKAEAQVKIFDLIEKYELCQKLCGQYKTEGSCFNYKVKTCNGACIGEENKEVYNKRALKLIADFSFENQNFIILDKGRSSEEKAIVHVRNGKYMGFGYVASEALNNTDFLVDSIKTYAHNRDVRQIIKNYVHQEKYESIVYID